MNAPAATPADLQRVINADRWPQQLQDMTGTVLVAVTACDPDMTPDRARLLSVAAVCAIATEYGGSLLYIPKNDAIRKAVRDLRMWSEYDGTTTGPNSINALAKRYKISNQTVWAILRKQRQLKQDNHHEPYNRVSIG